MARRISQSQLRSKLRQAQAKQRQAINKYNAQVRKTNRAIDNYNREARVHNQRVRANRQRLKRELQRLNRPQQTTLRYSVQRQSFTTVQESFSRLEAAAEAHTWQGDDELFDMSEGEAANSAATLNALLDDPDLVAPGAREIADLQTTTIDNELLEIDQDLHDRWRGALFALNPDNPDASRHFCTSAREMLDSMLQIEAPDRAVLEANPNAPLTDQGSVSRRARVMYCLERRGSPDPSLAAFIEADIQDVVVLFREFNNGTHGDAGAFDLGQLRAIKNRVEDAIRFVAQATS